MTVSHTITIYDEAWASFQAISTLEELEAIEAVLTADAADDDPVVAFNAGERLRAVQDVLTKRRSLLRLAAGQGTKWDRDRQAMASLRDRVKETVDCPTMLQLGGVTMRRTGCNRGRDEWHGPCPVCGVGVDRLTAWGNPDSRCWCRRCGWRADVIKVCQSLMPGCESFHDAVYWLADHAALGQGAA